jgi:hypothetical protein
MYEMERALPTTPSEWILEFSEWVKQRKLRDLGYGIGLVFENENDFYHLLLTNSNLKMLGLVHTEDAVLPAQNRARQRKLQNRIQFIYRNSAMFLQSRNVFDFCIDFGTHLIEKPDYRSLAASKLVESIRRNGLVLVCSPFVVTDLFHLYPRMEAIERKTFEDDISKKTYNWMIFQKP